MPRSPPLGPELFAVPSFPLSLNLTKMTRSFLHPLCSLPLAAAHAHIMYLYLTKDTYEVT
jgi:hypothetical protein